MSSTFSVSIIVAPHTQPFSLLQDWVRINCHRETEGNHKSWWYCLSYLVWERHKCSQFRCQWKNSLSLLNSSGQIWLLWKCRKGVVLQWVWREADRLKSVFSHSSSFIVPGLGSAKLTLSSRNLPRAGEGGGLLCTTQVLLLKTRKNQKSCTRACSQPNLSLLRTVFRKPSEQRQTSSLSHIRCSTSGLPGAVFPADGSWSS